MKKLVKARLFRSELFPVRSAEMVRRYNECLVSLGISPTALRSFSIDALGWSPEIAQEKQNLLYLGAGVANPMAVILSPDQFSRAAYMPFNSYDKLALDKFAGKFRQEITDITSTHALGLDIDDALSSYQSPRDLLYVDYVVVRAVLPELCSAYDEQARLVKQISEGNLSWFDGALRRKLVESAGRWGDLRFRRLSIPPMQFSEIKTFHTKAFGGVFVFSSPVTHRKILVLEGSETEAGCATDSRTVLSIHQNDLLYKFQEHGLVSCQGQYWKENITRLDGIIHALKLKLISDTEPRLNLSRLSDAKIKNIIGSLGGEHREVVSLLEKTRKVFAREEGNLSKDLPGFLKGVFFVPQDLIPEDEQAVVWQALSRLSFCHPAELFSRDRYYFYEMYRQWPESYKEWAINQILLQKHA